MPDASFCHECGLSLSSDFSESDVAAENQNKIDAADQFIKEYFYRGCQYTDIVGLLEKHHAISIHVRTLKRKLQQLG